MSYEELTKKQLDELKKQPITERKIRMSNDGNWVIIQTKTTDIISADIFKLILKEEKQND